MRRVIGFLALVVIVLAACAQRPDFSRVPDDFRVSYGEYGVGGVREAILEENLTLKAYSLGYTTVRTYPLSQEEREQLYAAIGEAGFFSLEDHYENTLVLDGTAQLLTVTADGLTKSVFVRNTTVPAFAQVVGNLTAILTKREDPWGRVTIEEEYMQCLQWRLDCADSTSPICATRRAQCAEIEEQYLRFSTKNFSTKNK